MAPVIHSLVIPATRDAIWEALTTASGLARWLCGDARIEPVVGGVFELAWDADEPRPAVSRAVRGTVRFLDRPRLLEVTWAEEEGLTTELRLEIVPSLDGAAVTLTHDGFPPGVNRARDACDRGWGAALRRLRDVLAR